MNQAKTYLGALNKQLNPAERLIMKLLVILLCLVFERYALQLDALRRKQWFHPWFLFLKTRLTVLHPALMLAVCVLPMVLVIGLFIHLFGVMLGLVLQIVVLFFCLGPDAIYPGASKKSTATECFESALRQWFAVLFWYVVLGLMGAVLYRLLELASREAELNPLASKIMGYLDWIPARLTGVLYLLVGHFQQGYSFALDTWWSGTENNTAFLTGCGLKATQEKGAEEVSVKAAEQLVWHAMILCLVGLACLTLAARW